MKNARRCLGASVLCAIGFLLLLPSTVRALQDLGVKEVGGVGEIVPYLYLVVPEAPLFGVACALLLLAIALLAIGVVLAVVGRFSHEASS